MDYFQTFITYPWVTSVVYMDKELCKLVVVVRNLVKNILTALFNYKICSPLSETLYPPFLTVSQVICWAKYCSEQNFRVMLVTKILLKFLDLFLLPRKSTHFTSAESKLALSPGRCKLTVLRVAMCTLSNELRPNGPFTLSGRGVTSVGWPRHRKFCCNTGDFFWRHRENILIVIIEPPRSV